MTHQVTISIPQQLYQRMRNLASAQNQPVDDLLETAVALAEATFIPNAAQVMAMAQEEAAYEALHSELMTHYQGEYVAIYQGQLIDHDPNELSLLRRLDQHYPDQVVLMKQVRPLPEPELHFRSPRFIPEGQ